MGRIVASLCMLMFVCVSYSQNKLDSLFDKAMQQNYKKEYAVAADLFVQAQQEALKASDTARYIQSLTAEGECYYMLELVAEIETVLKKARYVYDKYSDRLGKTSKLLILESISKLEGSYYYCKTENDTAFYSKAENAYVNCLNLIEKIKKSSSIDDAEFAVNVHRELLSLYYKQKLYVKALRESDIVYLHRRNIGFDADDSSACGRRDYYNFVDAYVSRVMVLARLKRFDKANELLDELPEVCDNEPSVLRTKGKIQMLQYAFDGSGNRCLAKEYYSRYITLFKQEYDKQLSTLSGSQREQYWLSLHDFLYDCYCLENYAPELLYDLALFSKGYILECDSSGKIPNLTWKDIRGRLKPDECAIEFVQYKNHDEERNLAALIIRSDCTRPCFVNIGSVDNIVSLPIKNGETLGTAITNDVGRTKDALYSDTAISNLIWNNEIMKETKNCKNIYFVPDGFLHQLAIEYMFPDTAVNCFRLSSTRQLSVPKRQYKDKMLICGGIDYYANVASQRTNNDIVGYNNFKNKVVYITRLNGTEKEVDSIYNYKNYYTSGQNVLLKGKHATDERFFNLIPEGFSTIHIATHGYFSGKTVFNDLKPPFRDNVMSESGLIMAGAGNNLKNKDFNPKYFDGVMTAKELSQLNLLNTDLIILSACQTGLGTITADGVYGMQRALKTAGVKAMVLSLWSVDDAATMEFMKVFHRELKENSSIPNKIHRAFNTARKHMLYDGKIVTNKFNPQTLTRKNSERLINFPHYANAFILIDGF